MTQSISLEEIRGWMERLFIAAPGARLRKEDEKKCTELVGFLSEVSGVLRNLSRSDRPVSVVDAAAGKGYVGLAIASILAPRLSRNVRLTFIERDGARLQAIEAASRALGLPSDGVDFRCDDVASRAAWPLEPEVVVALHACGDATDRTLEMGCSVRAKWMLVVPCCVASWLPAALRAQELAERVGIPRQAEVRRRFVEAHVLSDRVLSLEAAGWETTVAAFVAPTVTPYNALLRARRVGERQRMRASSDRLHKLRGPWDGGT